MKSKKVEGFILAGGRSSRMGTDKAFLKFCEKTFLENAIDILGPVCSQVSVVLNESQTHFIEKLPTDIPHIFDIFANRGALGGIHSALTNCRTSWAFVLACDMPFVTSDVIKKLVEIALDSEDFSAIVPIQSDGHIQPLCAVYQVESCLPKIEEILLKENSASVKYFLETVEMKTIETVDLDSTGLLFSNVNSPTDFEKLSSQ